MKSEFKIDLLWYSGLALIISVIGTLEVYLIPTNLDQYFTLIGIFLIGAYLVLFRLYCHESKDDNRREVSIPRFLEKYAFGMLEREHDAKLSARYSELLKKVSDNGVNISIFDNTGKFSPAFVIDKNIVPEIFVDRLLLRYLDEGELEMLILHELGHYKLDGNRKAFWAKAFMFSLLFAPLSLLILLTLNAMEWAYIVPLFFLSFSFLSMAIFIIGMKRLQLKADEFALNYSRKKELLFSLLNKLSDFAKANYTSERKMTRAIKEIEKRKRYLETL